MLIDWFTVAAQAMNFLILVWLLKRFLYQPILNAIDAREQRIAEELADAAEKQNQAKTERDSFEHKNQIFEQQREKLLQQAVDAADQERQKLVEEAQNSAEDLSLKHQQHLLKDAQNFKKSLSRKAIQEVYAITTKTLKDMATTSLEQQVVEEFKRRLSTLEKSPKALLSKALKALPSSEPVVLSSAFKLSVVQRKAIKTALEQTFGVDIALQYKTSVDLISGIEISANGQKVAWNIADYLKSLERAVDALIQEKSQDTAKAKPDKNAQTLLKSHVANSVTQTEQS